MKPELAKEEFVFCTIPEKRFSELRLKPLMAFREKEGTTIIVQRKTADNSLLSYSGVWALITLSVHSDLNVVGFLAAVTDKLARAGISVNAVSAYYHDHLFVPIEKAGRAITLLKSP